jgi:8-oxo-dGTP pyrophosphatase MutT (NUDIX family)
MDPASLGMSVCVWRRQPGWFDVLQVRRGDAWAAPSVDEVDDLVCIPIDAAIPWIAAAPAGWTPAIEHRWVHEDDAGPDGASALTQAGAGAVVWRRAVGGIEYLVLHRAHGGPAYAGDWAWTPPGGALDPGETHAECAARELREETGLEVALVRVEGCPNRFNAFVGEVVGDHPVRLDDDHDRFEWLPCADAARRCLPPRVGETILAAARQIGDVS